MCRRNSRPRNHVASIAWSRPALDVASRPSFPIHVNVIRSLPAESEYLAARRIGIDLLAKLGIRFVIKIHVQSSSANDDLVQAAAQHFPSRWSMPRRAVAFVLAVLLTVSGCKVRTVQQVPAASLPSLSAQNMIVRVTTIKGDDLQFDPPGATIKDSIVSASSRRAKLAFRWTRYNGFGCRQRRCRLRARWAWLPD